MKHIEANALVAVLNHAVLNYSILYCLVELRHKCTRGVSSITYTLSNCCIGAACVSHECLSSAKTLSLCLFVHLFLPSTECWTLTRPIPASLSFTVPVLFAKWLKIATENQFVFYGGGCFAVSEVCGGCNKQPFENSDRTLKKCSINSTIVTNMVLCSTFWPGCPACSPFSLNTIAAKRSSVLIFSD